MALILNIETSTKSTSVALAKNGKLIALREEHDVISHATKLTPFIDEILKKVKLKLTDLNAIAISIGPGSYTGLRIGLSTAKGLCYALNIPLISISGLVAMAYQMKDKHIKNDKLYVSVMNSRKNEVYLCLLDSSLNILLKPTAYTVDKNFLQDYENEHFIIGGTGLDKIKNISNEINKNITFLDDLNFSAKSMIKPTNELYAQHLFEDLAYLEPNYLKPFISI